jgi:hypothetical protein
MCNHFRVLVATLAVWGICAPANAIVYFCPRGDMGLVGSVRDGEGLLSASHGGFALHWPRTPDDILKTGGDRVLLNLKMSDCSNAEFLCAQVTHVQFEAPSFEYRLVVPRVIVPGKAFEYQGIQGVTQLARRGTQSVEPRVQVITRQDVGGRDMRLGLTVEQGRGVIYWDGFFFAAEQIGNGETCALRYELGLFSTAQLKTTN